MGRLAGKVAVISGGATGMGGAASLLFAAEGASVAIIDRDLAAAQAAAQAITAAGGRGFAFQADVSQADQVAAAVAAAERAQGPANVLFNHAGTIVIKPFLDTTEAEWDWLHAVNVKSMFLMTKAGSARHAGAGRRQHRLHQFDQRRGRHPDGGAVRHHQGRGPHVRPRHRGRVSRPGHPLQRRLPRLYRHAAWAA